MMNKSKIIHFLSLSFALAGFILFSGSLANVNAQTRDPFAKPSWAKPKTSSPSGQPGTTVKSKPTAPAVIAVLPPPIEQRIDYYKRLREDAALNGRDLPRVTSVLTLDEMSVTGIFRTPRGYAAMVEAKPINLSYTIYPGEKFFDGQLVAVEENRLVFRRVVKMSDGKFLASVENKTLRQYSVKEEVQGTAPVQPSSGKTEEAKNSPVPSDAKGQTAAPNGIISPLEEMNRQPAEKPEDSAKNKTDKKDKKDKKPVKIANNKN